MLYEIGPWPDGWLTTELPTLCVLGGVSEALDRSEFLTLKLVAGRLVALFFWLAARSGAGTFFGRRLQQAAAFPISHFHFIHSH